MKRFLNILCLLFVAVCVSLCSKADSGGPKPVVKQLVISASSYYLNVGEKVNFTASVKGNLIQDAMFYIGTKAISSSYSFSEVGVYSVFARKSGFTDSSPIQITVSSAPAGQLVLVADRSSVEMGEIVSFKVTLNSQTINDAYITASDGSSVLNGQWRAVKEGDYTFTASKEGVNSSNVVSVKVNSKPTSTNSFIKYNGNISYIDTSRILIAATKDSSGVFTPYVYTDALDMKYYKFYIDLFRRSTTTINIIDSRSYITLAVYQNPSLSPMLYPGESDHYATTFLEAYATLDFMIFKYFNSNDVVQMLFNPVGLNGAANIHLLKDNVEVVFKDNFTSNTLGFVEVNTFGKEDLYRGIPASFLNRNTSYGAH